MIQLNSSNTLVVIPAFNEQLTIASVVNQIKGAGFPLVVIDDGSSDQTRRNALEAGAKVISLPFNAGVGSALRCGFQYALENGFSAVIQCDADGQHPSNLFEQLVDAANESQVELVLGNRFGKNRGTMEVSFLRKTAIAFLSKLINLRTGARVSDPTSGFRLISRPLLDQFAKNFPSYYLGDTYEALIYSTSNGFGYREIDAPFSNRQNGKSTSSTIHTLGRLIQLVLNPLLISQKGIKPARNHSGIDAI
jgi:glycosyltransferase involved in cell wall biosynthesis